MKQKNLFDCGGSINTLIGGVHDLVMTTTFIITSLDMLCLYKVIDYNASHLWLESPQKEVCSLGGIQSERPMVLSGTVHACGKVLRIDRGGSSHDQDNDHIWYRVTGMEACYCPWGSCPGVVGKTQYEYSREYASIAFIEVLETMRGHRSGKLYHLLIVEGKKSTWVKTLSV
ncbi:hypothetical protein BDV27DRAFT_120548 [Aspergillus caelatus]|uniref:Uncharacterized protein n=1 Tax=Aspergillus caelatus TaxID=61420 RepID=A0A5N7AKN2_9EURO|nr:uncharacterized protein BDV27DRAFT_120548 [Aspergillus caelatus]KAE8369588.1 hypothetical protein BDV27DRAFT_120548 [Aspergillus caelatus]